MGALVAAVNKKGENVVPLVLAMLKELTHRGNNNHGIATPDFATTAATLEKLEQENIESSIALGHNVSYILPRDRPQPVEGDGFTFVFEGRMFPAPNPPNFSEPNEFRRQLDSNPMRNSDYVLEKVEGSYVFAVAESKRIFVGRDVFGATPLFYAENETVCVVASERKALWELGLKNAKSFPPGQLGILSLNGFSFHRVRQLRKPPKEKLDMETASRALETLLLESTRKQLSDIETVAVAFSGGVDSSVVAALAENVGLDVQLISVGLKAQPEVMFAEEAAEALDLPLHLQTYNLSDLEETFSKVLWLIEEPHAINACIGIPFYWLAETASKLGFPVLLAGQGADELFGGYQRYLTEYQKLGVDAVEQKMFHDVVNAYSANFQRDNQVCSYHGIELRLPFIDYSVVDFSLRLPLRFKIKSTDDKIRKHILRRVAHNFEVPSLMADKPKKAVQYTTGVTKALSRLAKNEKLSLREYVKKKYCEVFQP